MLCSSPRMRAQEAGATEAFDRYVATAEARMREEQKSTFLTINALPIAERAVVMQKLDRAEVEIEKRGDQTKEVPGGLIHDWIGTVFIPNVTTAQVIALVRDYNHTTNYYSPDVVQSRLISVSGDDMHVFMRLRKHNVITVVLDTEYDVHYGRVDAAHQYSISRSTRVSEIAAAGTPGEHALPSGHDHGFMWRLNSYWLFEQTSGGVYVQCEAISLTRAIAAGLGWMVGPIVNTIPRESLEFTLSATRAAFAGRATVSAKGN